MLHVVNCFKLLYRLHTQGLELPDAQLRHCHVSVSAMAVCMFCRQQRQFCVRTAACNSTNQVTAMAAYLFRCVAAASRDPILANSVAVLTATIVLNNGGINLPYDSVRWWWRWVLWLNPLWWSQQALTINEFRCVLPMHTTNHVKLRFLQPYHMLLTISDVVADLH